MTANLVADGSAGRYFLTRQHSDCCVTVPGDRPWFPPLLQTSERQSQARQKSHFRLESKSTPDFQKPGNVWDKRGRNCSSPEKGSAELEQQNPRLRRVLAGAGVRD